MYDSIDAYENGKRRAIERNRRKGALKKKLAFIHADDVFGQWGDEESFCLVWFEVQKLDEKERDETIAKLEASDTFKVPTKKQMREFEKRMAARDERIAFRDWLRDNHQKSEFLRDVWLGFDNYGTLSEKQIAAVNAWRERQKEFEAKKKERDEKEAATLPPVPTGRIAIAGEIVSLRWRNTQYGSQLKATVQLPEGCKVWGSVPSSFEDDVTKGDRVAFIATVKAAEDKPHFGYYSRPSKFSIVEKSAIEKTAAK